MDKDFVCLLSKMSTRHYTTDLPSNPYLGENLRFTAVQHRLLNREWEGKGFTVKSRATRCAGAVVTTGPTT